MQKILSAFLDKPRILWYLVAVDRTTRRRNNNKRSKNMSENTNTTGGKRNRRTRLEMAAALEAKLAKLRAQIAGDFDPASDESYMVTRLKRAIRRRDTALGQAGFLLAGKPATEKSPAQSSIDQKIENAEKRLADLHVAKARGLEIQARVPFDLDRLNELLALAIKGETVEFPTDLYVLPGENEKTEAEIEASVTQD